MEKYSGPTEAQLSQFAKYDLDAPVAALNLFWFNERSQHEPGDPEFGTDAGDITGEQAYAAYGELAGKAIAQLGGRVVVSTPVSQVMIGPDSSAIALQSCFSQQGVPT